ncbi:hypothetical protein [Aliidiomarina indica]|uniref:hypothetical protein n=1 Tax=Aliidiomarina indica TaxID=2749147 RepID=UPI00188F93C4|nr:hypothetical protein [Aliidiomarina indica]
MAVQFLIPIGRAAIHLARRWQGVLAIIGVTVATGFTLKSMFNQMGQTALSLWPLLLLTFFFLLIKEFIRSWFAVKNNTTKFPEKENDE